MKKIYVIIATCGVFAMGMVAFNSYTDTVRASNSRAIAQMTHPTSEPSSSPLPPASPTPAAYPDAVAPNTTPTPTPAVSSDQLAVREHHHRRHFEAD